MLPNSEDPLRAAEAFSTAAHDLALATRSFENPAQSYEVLGDLQSSLMAVHQTLQQMARLHERERGRAATDAADRVMGEEFAENAAHDLERAARCIDRATDEVISGFAQSGRIAWQPGPVEAVLSERAPDLEITETPPTTTGGPWSPPPSR